MKKITLTFLIALFIGISASFATAQTATRINFAKGAKQKIVTAKLKNYNDVKVFKLKVRAGQTIHIEQYNQGSHYVTVTVKSPSGEDVDDFDASCNNRKEITPTEAGDYLITVYECKKADEWRGNFSLKIRVD